MSIFNDGSEYTHVVIYSAKMDEQAGGHNFYTLESGEEVKGTDLCLPEDVSTYHWDDLQVLGKGKFSRNGTWGEYCRQRHKQEMLEEIRALEVVSAESRKVGNQ